MNRKIGLRLLFTLLTQVFIYSPASAADEQELSKYFAKDIDENFWAYGEIDNFLAANFIDGYKDASGNVFVQPNDPITRAQFSKMLVTSLRLSITSGQPKRSQT